MEECKACLKIELLERMQGDILKGENITKEITKIVSDIKDSHAETKYTLRDIKSNQDAMVVADKENKITMAAGFKAIEDKRLADELKIAKEKEDAREEQKETDKALLKEKRATKRGIYIAIIILAVNTVVGLLVKYAPSLIHIK